LHFGFVHHDPDIEKRGEIEFMNKFAYLVLLVLLAILPACSGGNPTELAADEIPLLDPLLTNEPYSPSLAGSAGAANAATLPALCNGAQDSDTASFAAEVIRLVNVERANAGLAALTSQSELTQAAQKHSIDMACNGFYSHTGSDGSSPFDRMDQFGYYYWTAAENIAVAYGTPSAVMAAWMGSAGHRANILNANFTEIGIGYIYNANDTALRYYHYWTMTLGSQ
jgi:uncharacterized protein YkwD